jgi:tetratricopeptide (TPR) repeat protein
MGPEGSFAGPSDSALAPSAPRLNEEGLALYALGDFPGAKEKFEAALVRNPVDRIVRRNLAYTLTRLAWREVEAERYEKAVGLFKIAEAVEPGDDGILFGRGVTRYLQGNDQEAKTLLVRALNASADLVLAHKVLGEIAYREDELTAAAARFETMLRLDPSDVSVRERLARVRHEARLQQGFRQLEGRHFRVKFASTVDAAFAVDVLRMLESAYEDVGRVLGYFPGGKIPVILYPAGEMRESLESPGWAQGMFDGKIRLSVGGVSDPEALNQSIRHEYTHALVHAWARGRAPTWMTEGLAVAFEGRDMRPEWAILRQADHMIPLPELHGSYLSLSPRQRNLAYAESVAAVRFLMDHYGVGAVQAFMKGLGAAKSLDQAFQDAVGLTYADFQATFVRHLMDARLIVGVGGAGYPALRVGAGPPSTTMGSYR